MKEVSEQLSMLRVLAFAVGVFIFLSVPAVSLSTALAQQQTTNNTAAGERPETAELSQQLFLMVIVDDEPIYQSISSDRTSVRIVDVSPSVVIQEVSYLEKAIMRNIGNVTNIATFVDNINHDGTTIVVHGVGKGIIMTENGDTVSWNAYGLGLPAGYGDGNNNDTGTNTTAAGSGLNTDRITTYRGIVFFKTNSENLSFMNNIVGLYISQVNNENGSSLRQIWEWRNN